MTLPLPASAITGLLWTPITWLTVLCSSIAYWVLHIAWRHLVFVNPP